MDSGFKLKVQNPKEGANFFSRLFFTWIIKTFRKILNSTFQISDLYKTLNYDTSEKLADDLEENWTKELEKAKVKHKKPKLLNAITRTFFWNYMIYGAILFLQHVMLRSLQPVVLSYLISLFDKDSDNRNAMYISSGILICTNLLIVFTMHHALFGQASVGMRIRVALSSLIYRKTLNLNRKSLNKTSIGQIVNLLSNDVTRFDWVVLTLHYLWILPFQVSVVTYLCWTQVGISSLVGVLSIAVLSLPVQGYLGKLTSIFRIKVAEKTDYRVTLMNEIISGIQVIKMYAWEKPFESIVHLARSNEIEALTVTSYLRAIYLSFMVFVERTALFLTLTCYVITGNIFRAEQVFSISQFFNLLQLTMSVFYPLSISYGAEALVSIKRIENFLTMEENEDSMIEYNFENGVTVVNVFASWTPQCVLLKDVSFQVPPGCLCAIVGPVGAGKSTILQLLLNEIAPKHGTIKLQGTVSYASQEPWLFTSTIRNNILFGHRYDRRLYKKIVKVCALQKDFDQFALADKTLVGERGATLSGGQRARINLARAVYREADIYLLDDPLSAVDTHVGKHLFQECIVKYLHGKTRILVTHQLQYLQKADLIIVINDGRVEARGSFKELSKDSLDFVKQTDGGDEAKDSDRVLTLSDSFMLESTNLKSEFGEEESTGMNKDLVSLLDYVKSSGNICLILFVAFGLVFCQILCSGADYWVTFWTQQEALKSQNKTLSLARDPIDTFEALYIYLGLIVFLIFVTFIRSFSYFNLAMKASKNLHNKMFKALVDAQMRFFNTNPAGRVLNRFSKDMGSIDEILPRVLLEAIQITLVMSGILVMVIISNYYMIPVIIILGIVFMKIRTWFIKTTKHIKHLEGLTKSPVFTHLNSSLQGITTIRAFSAQEMLQNEFDHLQDVHTSSWFLLITSMASFGLWLDLVCVVFIGCTSFSFILLNYYNQINGSLVGLAISQSLILTGMLQYGVRQNAEVVNQLTSVERIQQYTHIEKESPLTTPHENAPPVSWPRYGFLLIENVSLQYSPTKPPVLKNLNIEIQAGQKIGIVGRTGAGKSSLIAALFRLTEFSGSIYIDGVDTKTLGVRDLRRKLSIIPQEPVLFSATLRHNLDPFGEFSDGKLWEVLEEVEMKDMVSNLDMMVARGGGNFSLGQRQLVCLARAMLKNNKILVMDEATANTDDKTDVLIQKMIRKKFKTCTVLTIAHRLHTIMDSEKIIVMENGEIIEYDHPYLLLQQPESIFSKMVLETGLETSLHLEDIALEAFLHKRVPETH